MTALVQIDWYAFAPEPEAPPEWGGWPYYVHCDLCEQSAVDDIYAGLLEHDFRQFHKVHSHDGDNGLVVCEHCLPAFLSEQP